MDTNNPYGAPLSPIVATEPRSLERSQRIPWRWLRRRWGFAVSLVLVLVLLLPACIANILLAVVMHNALFDLEWWVVKATAHGGPSAVSTSPGL